MNIIEFQIKSFRELTCEIRDLAYYGNIDITADDLILNLNYEPTLTGKSEVSIFLHTQFFIQKKEDETQKDKSAKNPVVEKVSSDEKELAEPEEPYNTEDLINVLHMDFLAVFEVKNLQMKTNENNDLTMKKQQFVNLLSVAISTARGYISCRSSNKYLPKILLPIVNPREFLESSPLLVDDSVIIKSEI